jgi:hypothetical protein
MSRLMIAMPVLLAACANVPRPLLKLPPGDGCVAAIHTTWWGGTFEAAPGEVHGAGLELRTEGDVIVGFVAGRNTRLHVTDRLYGTFAGQPADLKIAHEDGRLVLRGTLGALGHVVIRSHPSRVDFYSDNVSVELLRGECAFRGTSKRFDDITSPVMQVRGCESMFAEPVFLLAVVAPFVAD